MRRRRIKFQWFPQTQPRVVSVAQLVVELTISRRANDTWWQRHKTDVNPGRTIDVNPDDGVQTRPGTIRLPAKPTAWPAWRQRFSCYTLASKLDREDKAVQISSLIYAMGPEAEKIYTTFTDDNTTLQQVLAKFDEHFVPRINVLLERALFYSRAQQPDENVETYVRKLYELSEHADFPNRREESIRDRLVLGVRDRELWEKLQLQANLTLKDAVQQARQFELVKHQLSEQRYDSSTSVDAVTHRPSGSSAPRQGHNHGPRGGTRTKKPDYTSYKGGNEGRSLILSRRLTSPKRKAASLLRRLSQLFRTNTLKGTVC